ncbi:MAG: hypothetical protein IJD92_01865 [Bacilli bacterium]|nr:hypothetical protein [Bacilli bacterium]
MINVLIGIFYIALIALVSYLLYYIIKIAIKDAFYEIELKSDTEEKSNFDNTDIDNQ